MWNDRFLNPCALAGRACFDPVTATAIAVGSTVAGGAVSAAGTIMGGNASADAGQAGAAATRQIAQSNADQLEFKAKQEDQAASESRASSQRSAFDKARETKLTLSKLQANAAASGGGASDPGVTNLAGQIGQRGEYEALTEMYKGENRARGLTDQATGDRFSANSTLIGGDLQAKGQIAEGNAKQSASYMTAAGTILGSVGSAAKMYKYG